SQILDKYEHEMRLGEIWIRGDLSSDLEIQFGRQIVVWGKSDNIRITDVINPLDMREPGMTDIEDLRLPVTMTRLDYSLDTWSLTGLIIHETRFNELPDYGSDYYPSDIHLSNEQKPVFSLDNQEFGLALNGIFNGWDLSIYGARLFDNQYYINRKKNESLEYQHNRINMLGGAVNAAYGNWLLKSETAFFDRLVFDLLPENRYARLDFLLGVEYSGFNNTTISLEAANRHILDYDESLNTMPGKKSENDFQWALRITRNFWHERLSSTLLANVYDALGQNGAAERLEFSYDLNDSWKFTSGLVLYHGGNNAYYERIKNNDRLFVQLKYSF
ncbi:MAG: hypothetical protein MJE63_08780, partial [Proteobacteria bacterium]|nr:hypothetical protein [Pseudomonadota bacterium]